MPDLIGEAEVLLERFSERDLEGLLDVRMTRALRPSAATIPAPWT